MFQKIKDLISAVSRDPFKGIGKPKPLKHKLSAGWLRVKDAAARKSTAHIIGKLVREKIADQAVWSPAFAGVIGGCRSKPASLTGRGKGAGCFVMDNALP
ncbi:MAG: type II toxin-antitoxin system YoeB family toxin [Treponema sp.]|nr:type II toxin-antitoxin system YoeB family toxin [Treponema sp.]